MKKILVLSLFVLLSFAIYGDEKPPPNGLEVRFIIKGKSLLCHLTNKSDKDKVILGISGGVTFITKFFHDGELITEDGPEEGQSISSPHFMIEFRAPKTIPPEGTYEFSIPNFKPPKKNQTVRASVTFNGKDFKLTKSYELKN